MRTSLLRHSGLVAGLLVAGLLAGLACSDP